jgi:hypothetical protein
MVEGSGKGNGRLGGIRKKIEWRELDKWEKKVWERGETWVNGESVERRKRRDWTWRERKCEDGVKRVEYGVWDVGDGVWEEGVERERVRMKELLLQYLLIADHLENTHRSKFALRNSPPL